MSRSRALFIINLSFHPECLPYGLFSYAPLFSPFYLVDGGSSIRSAGKEVAVVVVGSRSFLALLLTLLSHQDCVLDNVPLARLATFLIPKFFFFINVTSYCPQCPCRYRGTVCLAFHRK